MSLHKFIDKNSNNDCSLRQNFVVSGKTFSHKNWCIYFVCVVVGNCEFFFGTAAAPLHKESINNNKEKWLFPPPPPSFALFSLSVQLTPPMPEIYTIYICFWVVFCFLLFYISIIMYIFFRFVVLIIFVPMQYFKRSRVSARYVESNVNIIEYWLRISTMILTISL